MASEMVERVAKAIQQRLSDGPSDRGSGMLGMTELARAAIEAMREPTDAMRDAGGSVVGEIITGPPQPAYVFPDDQEHKNGNYILDSLGKFWHISLVNKG